MNADANFHRFCDLWNVEQLPDIGENLTYSHYSRRSYDYYRRNAILERNEKRMIPVCEGVLSENGRMRMPATLMETLSVTNDKSKSWNALLRIRKQQEKESKDHVAELRKKFKDFAVKTQLSKSLRTLTNRTIELLHDAEKDIIEKSLSRLNDELRPDISELWESLSSSHASQLKVCGDISKAEKQEFKLEMVTSTQSFENDYRCRKRQLTEKERTCEISGHPEVNLQAREERLIKEAYVKPKLADKVKRRKTK